MLVISLLSEVARCLFSGVGPGGAEKGAAGASGGTGSLVLHLLVADTLEGLTFFKKCDEVLLFAWTPPFDIKDALDTLEVEVACSLGFERG